MTHSLNPPLEARNGHTLETLFICRVSDPGPGKQDIRSLEDQETLHRDWLVQHTALPANITVIAGSGSGECLDRAESDQAYAELESGKYDLVLAEDLGRIFRRMHAYLFCEAAEDVETRVIAPNDSVDTAHDNWRLCAFFAAMRHEMYNADTGKRICRTLRSRFMQGGVFQCAVYGYVKPHAHATDDEVQKDPNAELIYDEWFTKLENGATYSEVADWLNELGVPTGPHCKQPKWDCRMVGRVTRNPILKGVRVRNARMAKRVNKTGRRKSIKAPPEQRLERSCPHLAFVAPDRYDRVIRLLNERNGKYRRKGSNGRDTRASTSKKRTRYPGQSVCCGVCGHPYFFGGHGQTDHLMCSGAREYQCWNGITFDGPDACRKLTSVLFDEIEALPGFESEFIENLKEERAQFDVDRLKEVRALEVDQLRNSRETDAILAAIREGGHISALTGDLRRLEQETDDLARRISDLQATSVEIEIPSVSELKQIAREEFTRLSVESQEFARLMRQLCPTIYVFPYRLLDGGAFVLRASVTLTAVPLISPETRGLNGLRERLTKQLVVDLFDPPQREEFRQRVVRMRVGGRKEHDVATELKITKTAAQRAATLQREMDARGVVDSWLPVLEPPSDCGKLRRHLHKRYRFEPLDGFPLEWPT